MNITNQIISKLICSDKSEKNIVIANSTISILDLSFTNYQNHVSIRDCIINQLIIHSSWFLKGFLLENCIIKDKIHYEMGGHNNSPIIIKRNIFEDTFIFFDCHFLDKIVIKNNIFCRGSSLLGNKTNTFQDIIEIEDNVGNLYLDQIE